MPNGAVPEHDVELQGVSKRFGQLAAVDDVSLAIRRGEFFSILGPSGSGKTTTLRLIAGFHVPDRGSIRIAGREVADLPPYRRDVNTVFQHYALFPHYDVYGNVAFGLKQRGVRGEELRRRVGEALDMVRMGDLGARRPRELSGGQQQRVALARALVLRPSVLLLDEPLGALDLKLRKEMQFELKNLQAHVGITFVYVTHDQEEALSMSDRIAVMNNGRVLQLGPPAEIYERPANRFVADFIGETNFLDGVVERVEGPFTFVRVGENVVPALAAHGDPAGTAVTVAVRPERVTLRAADQAGGLLPGLVERVAYVGASKQIQVRLTGGPVIHARSIGGAEGVATGELAVGASVSVAWLPENALVLSN